jgi:hypothetical protein
MLQNNPTKKPFDKTIALTLLTASALGLTYLINRTPSKLDIIEPQQQQNEPQLTKTPVFLNKRVVIKEEKSLPLEEKLKSLEMSDKEWSEYINTKDSGYVFSAVDSNFDITPFLPTKENFLISTLSLVNETGAYPSSFILDNFSKDNEIWSTINKTDYQQLHENAVEYTISRGEDPSKLTIADIFSNQRRETGRKVSIENELDNNWTPETREIYTRMQEASILDVMVADFESYENFSNNPPRNNRPILSITDYISSFMPFISNIPGTVDGRIDIFDNIEAYGIAVIEKQDTSQFYNQISNVFMDYRNTLQNELLATSPPHIRNAVLFSTQAYTSILQKEADLEKK